MTIRLTWSSSMLRMQSCPCCSQCSGLGGLISRPPLSLFADSKEAPASFSGLLVC